MCRHEGKPFDKRHIGFGVIAIVAGPNDMPATSRLRRGMVPGRHQVRTLRIHRALAVSTRRTIRSLDSHNGRVFVGPSHFSRFTFGSVIVSGYFRK